MIVVKVNVRLGDSDFEKLADALREETVDSVELMRAVDYGFVKTSSLIIARSGNGYSISSRIVFEEQIGFTAGLIAQNGDSWIRRSFRKIELNLERPAVDLKIMSEDIKHSFSLIEEAINYACEYQEERIAEEFLLDGRVLDLQIEKGQRERNARMRGEKLVPFAIVHGDSGFDIIVQSDYVPFFEEYDKYDLYGASKSFTALPRSFVNKLLKCENAALVSERDFDSEEKAFLKKLEQKKLIKQRRVLGEIYYYELNSKSRLYLLNAMKKRRNLKST